MCHTTVQRMLKQKNRILRLVEWLTALHDMIGQEGQLRLQQGSPKPPNSLLQYHVNSKEILSILNWFGEYRHVTVAGFTYLGILQF